MSDSELQIDMEAVGRHWSSYLKTAFVLFKALTTIYLTLGASKIWFKSST
jgi:hypothetical protein